MLSLSKCTVDQFVAEVETEAMNELDTDLQDIRKTLEVIKRLTAAGFQIPIWTTSPRYCVLDCETNQLTLIRKIVGAPLKKRYTHPESDRTHVTIVLQTDAAPYLRIKYKQKLKENSPCHIEPEYIPTYKLVCKR